MMEPCHTTGFRGLGFREHGQLLPPRLWTCHSGHRPQTIPARDFEDSWDLRAFRNLVAEWIDFTLFWIMLPTMKPKVYTFWGL